MKITIFMVLIMTINRGICIKRYFSVNYTLLCVYVCACANTNVVCYYSFGYIIININAGTIKIYFKDKYV